MGKRHKHMKKKKQHFVSSVVKTKKGVKISKPVELGKLVYVAQKPNYSEQEKLNFINMTKEKKDQFLNKVWVSFIETKKDFMKSDKTLNEVIQDPKNKIWKENPHYFDLMLILNRIVMIREKLVNYVDFKGLRGNEHYQDVFSTVKATTGIAGDDIDVFVSIRNSIAHSNVKLFENNGTLKLLFLGNNQKKNAPGIPYELLKEYIEIVSDNVDFGMKKHHDLKDLERHRNKILNDRNLTDEEKREKIDRMVEGYTHRPERSNEQVHFEVYEMYNKFMMENPNKTHKEIMDLVFAKINEKYNEYDENGRKVGPLPEKKMAFLYALEDDRMLAYDIQHYLRFVFTTLSYEKVKARGHVNRELSNYMDAISPNSAEYLDKKFGGHTDYDSVIKEVKSKAVDSDFQEFVNAVNNTSLQEMYLHRKDLWTQLPPEIRNLIPQEEIKRMNDTGIIERETRISLYNEKPSVRKQIRKGFLKSKNEKRLNEEKKGKAEKSKERKYKNKNHPEVYLDEFRNSILHERVSLFNGSASLSNMTLAGVDIEKKYKQKFKRTNPLDENYADAVYYANQDHVLEKNKNKMYMGDFTNEELFTLGKLIMKNGQDLLAAEKAEEARREAEKQRQMEGTKDVKQNPKAHKDSDANQYVKKNAETKYVEKQKDEEETENQ